MTEDPTNETLEVEGGWRRRGACNACGWCCEFLGHQPLKLRDATDEAYLKLRGFRRTGSKEHTAMVAVHTPCQEHDLLDVCGEADAGRCRIYDERPTTCRRFPTHPDQIAETPCSYWFERETNGRREVRTSLEPPEEVDR